MKRTKLRIKNLINVLSLSLIYIMFCIKTSATGVISMRLNISDKNHVKIGFVGSGTIKIDWNCDEKEIVIYELEEDWENETITYYTFTYNNVVNFFRTITITGENITFFDCSYLGLINLDVSNILTLKALDCSFNQLTELIVKNNMLLKELYCSNNKLTNLDVSNNLELETLFCNNNNFENLDISRNHNLKTLSYDEKNVKLIKNKNQIGQKIVSEKDFCEELQEIAIGYVEQPPKFVGILDDLMKFVDSKIIYPTDVQNDGIQGKVVVQFVITTEGRVRNVRTVRSLHYQLDEEAERIVKLTDEKWEPGIQDGKPVNVLFTLPISFVLPAYDSEVSDETASYDYDVEEMPEFIGGEQGLLRFLANNIRYPPLAQVNRIQGKVIVKFVVSADGSICDIIATQNPHYLLSTELVRVILLTEGMWKPGKKNGVPVSVSYTVPMNFVLDDDNKLKKEKETKSKINKNKQKK